jgi:predicted Rossmann fold nucleotide-binding protein DprA/Smf involved in DNA uptake
MSTNTTHTTTPGPPRRISVFQQGEEGYPPAAVGWTPWNEQDALFVGDDAVAGPTLATIGSLSILTGPTIGLLCSVRCPGNLILATYDFAKRTPHKGPAIIGGFHSPMERTSFETLLVRHVPIVCVPARRLNQRGIPRAWWAASAEDRLLILSPFTDSQRHVTRDLAHRRNLLIAALSDTLFVPHATRGGETEAVARMSLHRGKMVYTLEDEENAHLMRLGARGVTVDDLLTMAHQKSRTPLSG